MVGTQNWKIIFSISLVALFLIYLLDRYITDTEEVLYESLELSVVKDMSDIAKNVDILIKKHRAKEEGKSLFEYFENSDDIRRSFESRLNLLITSKIKYLYLIYQDKNNKFRYLIDGSSEDKAHFNEKFDVEASQYYDIYESRTALAIKQENLEKLSITYLYPVVHNGEVEAILVFDFSSHSEYELRKIIAPLKTMFMLIYVMIGVFLIVTMFQTLLYYQARKRSYVDALTGFYNRQYLRYFLDIHNIADYKVMMIDFDYFKKVNDNYGHDIGDKVLVFGSQTIYATLLKSKGKCFRYGGEEFLVLVHKSNDVCEIAESIRTNMQDNHFIQENIDINMTVSIGVNTTPSYARNTSQAISIADSMLYQAKSQGRNRVVSYTHGMEIDVDEKQSTSHNIHEVVEALEEERIVCHFHKIIDKNNTIYKYEALVRYINSEGKMIYPNHFLSDISYTKVYTDLTKRVIDICIDTIRRENIKVSLNLNVNDLLNKVLVSYLIEKVNSLKKESSYLTVEILEHEEIRNVQELQGILEIFHSQGIKIAIDDFGSGHANFNYLVDLNVDYIKIDGYLVESAVKSEKSRNIVKSIIDLAHEMQIKTIVEFVSSQEVYDLMVSLETDYMQGFYISKPEAKI